MYQVLDLPDEKSITMERICCHNVVFGYFDLLVTMLIDNRTISLSFDRFRGVVLTLVT